MRVRGRRVVLLIAGALPLLAEDERSRSTAPITLDDLIDGSNNTGIDVEITPSQQRTHEQVYAQKEEEALVESAAKALHEESLSLLPLNLLQIEAELFNETGPGVVAVDRNKSTTVEADLIHDGDDQPEEQVDRTSKEPPDKGEENDVKADAEAVVESQAIGGNETETVEDPEGEETEAEAKTEERQGEKELESEEESTDKAQASANLVADPEENAEEANSSSSTATVDENVSGGEREAQEEEEEGEEYEDVATNDTSSHENVKDNQEDENLEDASEEKELPAEDDGKVDATTSSSDDIPSSSEQQQQQQPAPGPQVDKIDDDDEEISKRVAVDYASKSAGALVLEKSPNFKGTSNLLHGDRDKYAISPCEENKFVVLSLSEDILVKQVKLANYELYSSRVKDFQIQISATMGNWVDLGSYTASPASGVQSFDLREPAWGRYLKFKFNSHYGDEYYCTLSQIMVHGSTMVQGFHEHLQETSEEEEQLQQQQQQSEEGESASTDDDDEAEDSATGDASAANGEGASEDQQATSSGDETTKSNHEAETEAAEARGSADGADGSTMDSTDDGSSASDDDSTDTEDLAHDAQEANNASQREVEGHDDEDDDDHNKMSSKKTRNASTAIPAASISVSSTNVFTTIIGRLEPLQLKSMHRLSNKRSPDANQFQTILAKASDSTKAIKRALTDPAILDNFQLWNEANIEKPFPPEAFGSTAIGPREQTLTEKLAAYIEDNDDNRIVASADDRDDGHAESAHSASTDAATPKDGTGKEDNSKKPKQTNAATEPDEMKQESSEQEEQQSSAKSAATPDEDAYETLHDTDLALANLLDKLPSIDCLKRLDYAAFKEKALASRRGGHGAGGHPAAGNPAEPIFKMLTDQIKVLQSNLSVQDQFTKEAVQCYQKVLLDVVVELQTMRLNHEARLDQLERDLEETKTVRWIFVLYQLVMGLPNWASLLAATFFTSFVSRDAVTKPLELVQGLLDKYISEGDHVVLSWTITVCIVILCCVSTISLCYRLLSAMRYFKGKPEAEETQKARKDPTEENSCRFTVANADGKIVSVSTKPLVDSDAAANAESVEVPGGEKESVTAVAEQAGASAEDKSESPGEEARSLSGPDKTLTETYGTTLNRSPSAVEEDRTASLPDEIPGEVDVGDEEAQEEEVFEIVEEVVKSFTTVPPDGFGIGTLPPVAQEQETTTTDLPPVVQEQETKTTGPPSAILGEAETFVSVEERPTNGECREDSGARTPEVETEILLADSLAKGPVSPSSVARVSEFTSASATGTRTEGRCLGQGQEEMLAHCQDGLQPAQHMEAPLKDHTEQEQKRRASF